MKTGNNPSSIRAYNMQLILDSLYKEPLSSTDLAKKINLSKPAMTKIMGEMIDLNLISSIDIEKDSEEITIGRRKVYYTINGNSGLVGVIYYEENNIEIFLAAMTGTIIKEISLNKDVKNEVLINHFKHLLNNETIETKNLLSICIVMPKTYNQETDEKINLLKEELEKVYDLEIFIKKDIHLMMINQSPNAILIYVDSNICGAILNQDKIIEGDKEEAGLFGYIKAFDRYGNRVDFNTLCSIDSLVHQIQYEKNLNQNTLLPIELTFIEIVNEFYQGNEGIERIVLESAKHMAGLISNLYHILNCQTILIGGRITMFGEKYLNEVKDHLDTGNEKISISYISVDKKSIKEGAVLLAIKSGFDVLLENRKK